MADTGHVKHNSTTNEIAIRTSFDETQFPNMVWLIASTNMGARNGKEEDVKGWDDLYTPPPPPVVNSPDPSVVSATTNP